MIGLLKVLGVVILGIGSMKVVLGAKADALLDPTIPDATVRHPSVDSQVRFYGGAFALYGVLLWLCSNDMTRYEPVFRAMMIVFFLAGVARLPGAARYGRPSIAIVGLTVIELVVPPLLLWWQSTLWPAKYQRAGLVLRTARRRTRTSYQRAGLVLRTSRRRTRTSYQRAGLVLRTARRRTRTSYQRAGLVLRTARRRTRTSYQVPAR